jgi:hypothetical protein
MVEAVTSAFRHLWALLACLLAIPSATFAHQLDEYLQATLVAIEPHEIRLSINLTPGVAIADQVISRIDVDRDNAISSSEAAAYAESLRRDLTVRLDGKELPLDVTETYYPDLAELRTGWGIIQLQFSAPLARLTIGPHQLAIDNRHVAKISVYLLNAALPKSPEIHITRQDRNPTQSASEIDFYFRQPAAPSRAWGILAISSALLVTLLAVIRRACWRMRLKTRSHAVPAQ